MNLDESEFFTHWDAEIAKNHIDWIDIWFDRYLRQGERIENIFNLLRNWLSKRRTLSALEFVAAAIVHAGRRRDLDLLCVDCIEPAKEAEAIVADTHFSVSRRSLV